MASEIKITQIFCPSDIVSSYITLSESLAW